MMNAQRFRTPDGDTICVQPDGDMFVIWPENQPDRWVASSREFFAVNVAEAVGYDVAHDDLPAWIESFGQEVLAELDRAE